MKIGSLPSYLKHCIFFLFIASVVNGQQNKNQFPDGTVISKWFSDSSKLKLNDLGKPYKITDYGVLLDSTVVQTIKIQAVIDLASKNGGGVVIIPNGVFLSGALFFKPKTHLYLEKDAVLKGSDLIENYPIMPSRMEGQNINYFPALVNAYGVDNFSISGKGTINGNGLNYWKAFWKRREENPKCTNLEVSRPRLVFIWNSNNVQLQDVKLINAGFWTSHYYQCDYIKLLDLYIYSPDKPVKAPSTDAIDLDVCNNVLIKGCYMSVNDDAIALKGGKGPYAETTAGNGVNSNVIIEDCEFGYCSSALTHGSEAIHNRNIIMRNCKVDGALRLLWLKMRPDTPQLYEYILVENIKGHVNKGLEVYQWKQFFDLDGRMDPPLSTGEHITMRHLDLTCERFFAVDAYHHIKLKNFTFEDSKISSKDANIKKRLVDGIHFNNVTINNHLVR
ncbi:rhamnogalacturonidase [Pseudotamlana agarivorans]|uniref:rhamnogalacturonidase n=1 Tax=Pseudotamlana agarivorans TaxID=481183 RepID=UPI00082BACF0|nr:glycosyl hydrolase family 28 protein [Tamlana agarivorans]